MSIIDTELIWRKSATNDDTASNGGRMTATEAVSGTKNNIWPDVPQSERTAGSTKYRKIHIHVANDDDFELIQARVFVETYTPGDDVVMIGEGTHTDVQSAVPSDWYGGGQLDSDVSSGTTIDVAVDVDTAGNASTLDLFRVGDFIRISDKTDVDDSGGNEQWMEITTPAPSYASDVVTLNLVETIAHSFTAVSTRVSSVIDSGDISGSYDTFVVTTAGDGDYDDTTYPILPDHIGGVEGDWKLTFDSATTFDVELDIGAGFTSVGSGNTSADLTITNTDYTKPYFFLDADGWTGTWANLDTLTFTTHPASIPIWYKRIVPAGASSLSGNKVIVAVDGQSA